MNKIVSICLVLCALNSITNSQSLPANYKYIGFLYFLREFHHHANNCDLTDISAADASLICEQFSAKDQVANCKAGVALERNKRHAKCNPSTNERICRMYGRRAAKLAYADICDHHFNGKTYNQSICYDWALNECKTTALQKINRSIEQGTCGDIKNEFTSSSITPICELATKKMLGMQTDIDNDTYI